MFSAAQISQLHGPEGADVSVRLEINPTEFLALSIYDEINTNYFFKNMLGVFILFQCTGCWFMF